MRKPHKGIEVTLISP